MYLSIVGSSALGLLLLSSAGCAGSPRRPEPAQGHPAYPFGASSFATPLNPFEATPTFARPDADAAVPGPEGMRSHDVGEATVRYTCPMHPEVIRSEPGRCPECGMALRPAPAETAHDHGERR